MTRYRSALTALILTSLLAGGCITSGRQVSRLAASAIPGHEERALCRTYRTQGWGDSCSPSCGRKPAWCGKLELLSCDAVLCWWEARDGSLLVTYVGAAPPVEAPEEGE